MKLFLLISLIILFPATTACGAEINGSEPEKSVSGSLKPVGEMKTGRAGHTATLLKNGRVLVAGGFTGDEKSLAGAEIFDPATNTFSPADTMNTARSSHTATALPGGKILVAGGYNGDYLDSAEIYDPKTGKFTGAGKMTLARSEHTAVLLGDGRVLLAGGVGTNWTFLNGAEIYDPATKTFTATGNMVEARESHTATLLGDGKVLITGGHRGRRSAITIYSSAEIYDPANGLFKAAADLTVRRHKHEAVLLKDGRVLIIGGSDERDSRGIYTSVEIFDTKTKSFARLGDMNLSRYKLRGTAVLLANGKLLIAGGADQTEIFDPADNTFYLASGKFESIRLFATATLLENGRVLIVGGYDHSNSVSSKAWIYSDGKDLMVK